MAQTKAPRLLMVDDDDEDIYLTRRAFCEYNDNLAFNSVHSGVEMFDHLNRCDQSGESVLTPHVILLDINLPQENGFTILEQLRDSSFAHLPVTMLTTSSASYDIQKAYSLGASSYMCKSQNKQGMQEIAQNFCNYWFDFAKLPVTL